MYIFIDSKKFSPLFFRMSCTDQSTLLSSNMKKYIQYAKAYIIYNNLTYDEEYFNSIDVEAQFIGCQIVHFLLFQNPRKYPHSKNSLDNN